MHRILLAVVEILQLSVTHLAKMEGGVPHRDIAYVPPDGVDKDVNKVAWVEFSYEK